MKRLFSLLTLLALLLTSALADPIVTASEEAKVMPEEVIQQLASDYPTADAITIVTWMDADLSEQMTEMIAADYPANVSVAATGWQTSFTARSSYQTIYYLNAARETTEDFIVLEDILLTTRAKGSHGPLDEAFDHTVASSLSQCSDGAPPLSFAELGMTEFLRAYIPAGEVFAGPAENSPCNSREYRIRWFGRTGTWNALYVPESGDYIPAFGEWTEVTGYVIYAIDRFIAP